MGELKFHLYPTVSKFCICPVLNPTELHHLMTTAVTTTGLANGAALDQNKYWRTLAFGFNQTDTDIKIPHWAAVANQVGHTFETVRLTSLRTSRIKELELVTRQNMLKPEVAAALQQSYLQTPLMFPILTWQYMAFSSEMTNYGSCTPATTIALQHCDTGFLLFRRTAQDLTCYINPEIEWRLQMGTRLIPAKAYRTYEDLRFFTLFYDGLNIKNNSNFKLQDSIYHSLQPYVVLNVPQNANAQLVQEQREYQAYDRSNFCIPIPFTPDEWFQGGISQPNSPLKLTVVGHREDRRALNGTEETWIQPIFAYCQDHILRIFSTKPGLAKQIDISTRSVAQILATGQA